MICCCTGHRPQGFPWAYNVDKQKYKNYKKELLSIIEYLIKEKDVSEFISGMALGADSDFAECVLTLRKKYKYIRLRCAIPCRDQTRLWDKKDVLRYEKILKRADCSVVLSEHYTRSCMFERNRYMVDNSDYVLAVWNGEKKGGTWYTIDYASKKNKPIEVLDLNKI